MAEGKPAVLSLLEYLRSADPAKELQPLQWDDGVARATKHHVEDTGLQGLVGHIGSQGETPMDRVIRYANGTSPDKICMAESLNYGENEAKEVLLWLAIDDGVESRGHRNNIMNPAFTKFGCHQGYH